MIRQASIKAMLRQPACTVRRAMTIGDQDQRDVNATDAAVADDMDEMTMQVERGFGHEINATTQC